MSVEKHLRDNATARFIAACICKVQQLHVDPVCVCQFPELHVQVHKLAAHLTDAIHAALVASRPTNDALTLRLSAAQRTALCSGVTDEMLHGGYMRSTPPMIHAIAEVCGTYLFTYTF
jgi:hypothetical protein